jgi:hypothetical protein
MYRVSLCQCGNNVLYTLFRLFFNAYIKLNCFSRGYDSDAKSIYIVTLLKTSSVYSTSANSPLSVASEIS